MLLGRIFGTFIAAILTLTVKSDNLIIEVALFIFYIAFGTAVGMFASILFGPNIDTDQPYPQDSEDYWVERYGVRLGKDAYRIWLEELDKID